MKFLVTGGAGFIGSWVVDYLLNHGKEVVVIDNLSTGKRENVNKKARFYKLDIRDKKISRIFEREKPDYVFHLAAQIDVRKSIEDTVEDAHINILGSLNILNNCVKHGVKKIIFSSSGGAIYGDECKIPASEDEKEKPMFPYGVAKLAVDKYLKFFKKVYGLDYVSLRYSNVYGPRQGSKGEAGVVAIFIKNMLNGKKVKINGSGEQTRDFVYVRDVARANLLALNLYGIFNIGTGKETSVNRIFEELSGIIGKAEKFNAPAIKGEQMRSCLNSDRIKKFGWIPEYDLEKGLKETVDYFKRG